MLHFISQYYHWVVTAVLLLSYPILARLLRNLLTRLVTGNIEKHRQYRANLLLDTLLAAMLLCLIVLTLGIELKGLLVVGSSLLAMFSVALFAGWSLLSNLTSFLLLLIQNKCKVGSKVRIVDGSNFIEGTIVDMGLINVTLANESQNEVLYPNNLFVVRPVIIIKYETKNATAKYPFKRPLK